MLLKKIVISAIGLLWMLELPANATQAQNLEIGILPHLSTRILIQQYQPLREFLEQELGQPIQILTAPDFKQFYQRTVADEYDIVITAPHFAGLAEIRAGYQPMLVFHPEIQGLIITAKHSALQNIDDLRGQTLVMPNPKSLMVVKGLVWLAEHNLQAEQDFHILNTANQDSVGDVVLNGKD